LSRPSRATTSLGSSAAPDLRPFRPARALVRLARRGSRGFAESGRTWGPPAESDSVEATPTRPATSSSTGTRVRAATPGSRTSCGRG